MLQQEFKLITNFAVPDSGRRDCLRGIVLSIIRDGACPIPYICCNILDTSRTSWYKRKLLGTARLGFLNSYRTRIHITLSPRVYKGGQGLPPKHNQSKAIQTTIQDVGYYATRTLNLSKPCVACTFEFLIMVTPCLQTYYLRVSLGRLGSNTPTTGMPDRGVH
jgi:hypothetical protein